ncbi:MAG: hypothetical protein K0V04_03585 [Deltaproteobacteria bacterium]|nr:hypothetical protein [Deltaproteobacteria bacterium]
MPSPTPRRRSRSCLLLGTALLAMSVGACDAPSATALELDLSHHGVDQVLSDRDGHHQLLDADGHPIGAVERTATDHGTAISVALRGSEAAMQWSDDDDGQIECQPAVDWATDDPIAGCSTALTIASEIAEAEGVDVPGYTAAEAPLAFRLGCVTISTWVWGHAACSACYKEAKSQTTYPNHDGGTCDGGSGPWTNCTHTFCGGGFQPEGPGES